MKITKKIGKFVATLFKKKGRRKITVQNEKVGNLSLYANIKNLNGMGKLLEEKKTQHTRINSIHVNESIVKLFLHKEYSRHRWLQ